MTTLSWTVPMYLPETPSGIQVNNEELWHAMVHKAQDPAKYVPYITGCEVLEEYEDGLLREITYADGRKVRERVVYEPPTRMTFQAHNDPDIAEIVNEIGTDGDGRPTFTLRLTLTGDGQLKGQKDPEFLPHLSKTFAGSLLPIVHGAINGT
ncbi:SRPBCC family protein [Streptomyces cyaneofuscatus]|uniref:SRPBCC family protein n=1 Tax=Streptomyces cyaneofuscatus TaxID=66883 RepID=UPI002D78E61C|nr:SRPBCC family protein [Streptomyces cyaneofuscatus]WRO13874.1 SRPBCC family protein [Streptomyces cyaneofuscatus]